MQAVRNLGCTLGACTRSRPGSLPRTLARWLAPLGAACVLVCSAAGCDSSPGDGADAGTRPDATLADGAVTIGDGGARDASVAADAASRDGGVAPLCAGDCDPTIVPGPDAGVGGDCEPGLTCALRDRVPVCHPTSGVVADGEACDVDRICAPGLACFALASGPTCAAVCCPGDDSLCPSGQRCGGDGMLASGVATSWGRCLDITPCVLFESTCATREGCYIVSSSGDTSCLLAGDRAVGESCDVDVQNQCAPGLFCAGVGEGRCVRLCSLTDGSTCPREEGRCIAQTYSPPDTGVCVGSSPT